MNTNLLFRLSEQNKFWICILIFFVMLSGVIKAQDNYISIDDGKTYFINQGNDLDSNYHFELISGPENFIRILDFIDNQYPRYPYPLVFGDADNNGKIEMYRGIYISSTNNFMRVYEFDKDLSYTITDLPYYGVPWAIGDINNNGKTNLVIQTGDGANGILRIYESPNEFSLPNILIEEVIIPGRNTYFHAKIVDTDLDGQKEILMSTFGTLTGDIRIYEWDRDQLQLKWIAPEITGSTITKAVADFNQGGKIEIATVNRHNNTVYVYECPSNDTYILKQSWNIPNQLGNIDALEPINFDGENPVFGVGRKNANGNYDWLFYKEENNTFNLWQEISFPDGWVELPRHAVGDYNNDGLDEIVVRHRRKYVKMLKYIEEQIQVIWEDEVNYFDYIESCDIRNDNVINFVVADLFSYPSTGDGILKFYEEEKLANAYLNKSLSYYATAYNNNHTIERGYFGRLHEVFHSDGEIFYRRSSNNGESWDLTTRLSSGNGNNEIPSIVAAGLGAKDFLCVVWQRKITNYQYEIYTRFSGNSGLTWSEHFSPITVTISYSQSNENYGPGTTPVIAAYQSDGQKYLLVYATETGLYYRTAAFGFDWSAANIVPGSYGPGSTIWFPSVASYNNLSTQVNLIYDDRFSHVYSQIFNGTSWTNRVVTDWIGSYNRMSSIAVDYANSTLAVWSGWNSKLSRYTIRFRQGFSDGSWSSWSKEWSGADGVNSFHPVISYYNKPDPYPYGIDILWYTSPNNQIRQKKYYGIGDNWIPTDPNTQLLATDGMFANITHERQNTPVPIQTWTDQSTSPVYSILYNSDYLPKENLAGDGEIRRAAEITDASNNSNFRLEISEPIITLNNGDEIRIPFKEYNYLVQINLTTANVFNYLQTEPMSIPNNAQLFSFKVNFYASQPDTLPDGSLNTNQQTPFRGINFSLAVRRDSSNNILQNNIGSHSLNNNSGLHNFSHEFVFNATPLRGRNIRFTPNVGLTGPFNEGDLRFTLVNVAIEGSGLAKDSSEVAKDNLIPAEYGLTQNYPNPFNPVTQIQYSIVKDGLVTLKVFDVLGREVATLVNEEKPAGVHTINFDASTLASGIYFYSIKTGNFYQVKKMLLIK